MTSANPTGLAALVLQCRGFLRSNRGFLFIASCAASLFLLTLVGPAVMEQLCGQDGPGAARFRRLDRLHLYRVSGVSLAIVALAFVACWSNPRHRGWRTCLLLATVTSQVVLLIAFRHLDGKIRKGLASGNLFEQQWGNLDRLKFVEFYSPTLARLDSRQAAQLPMKSFKDLHRWGMEKYQRCKERMAQELGISEESRLKVIYVMNFVANLWAFGNKHHVDRTGCVACSEDNNWIIPKEMSVQTYLRSRIACCNDMAYLVKYFLDQEQFENRLTVIPGHIFNEVKIQGKWHIVDATINAIVETSWEENYQAKGSDSEETIRVMVFPHPNLDNEEAWDYRPQLGTFRLAMFLRFANRPACLECASYVPLPEFIR